MVSMFNSVQIMRIFFGPMPLICSISIMPAGVICLSASNSAITPVSMNSTILLAALFPTPSIFAKSSKLLLNKGSAYLLSLKLALVKFFILKGFSSCNSSNCANNLSVFTIDLLSKVKLLNV